MPDTLDQADQPESKPFRDRTRGRSRYIRAALVRIFRMKPEERKAYKPENGFEECALKHFDRCEDKTRGTAALSFLLVALGEKVSVDKDKEEKPDGSAFSGPIDDLPRPAKKVQ